MINIYPCICSRCEWSNFGRSQSEAPTEDTSIAKIEKKDCYLTFVHSFSALKKLFQW